MAIKVELEAIDGAGKTTGLKYLIGKLEEAGQKVLETREVGSPLIPVNVKLRELILDPTQDISGKAMELVFAAMRLENDRLYKKVSSDYDFIVSDRGWFSHLAYTDHNESEDFTKQLYMDFLANHASMPDVVVYFAVDGETALKRRIRRGEAADVIELKGPEFQEKVRSSFEKYMSQNDNVQYIRIDATQDLENVKKQIDTALETLLQLKNK